MRVERVLVTGGSGFIGTNLVQSYFKSGTPVLSVDTRPPRQPAHRAVWQRVDCSDSNAMRSVIDEFEPTHIVHLAARTDLQGSRTQTIT